jgi:hypothetical protein
MAALDPKTCRHRPNRFVHIPILQRKPAGYRIEDNAGQVVTPTPSGNAFLCQCELCADYLQSGWEMIRLTAMVGLFKIGLYEPNEGQIKHPVRESYQPMQTWTDNAPVRVIFNFET